MIIDKNILPFIIFSEDTVINALRKINANKSGFVFTVDQTTTLEGVITDGDIRRWLTATDKIDLDMPVSLAANKKFISAHIEDNEQKISSLFTNKIRFIPLTDNNKRLIAIARKGSVEINIGGHIISDDTPSFVIAEIGNNHNGKIGLAKRLINAAVTAGATSAKFQMRKLDSLYRNYNNKSDNDEDLGAQYTLDLLTKFNLEPEVMFDLFNYCKDQGILPLCTPWDLPSVEALEKYGVEAYKVASADMTNHQLLAAIASTHKPIIMSTGMSNEPEIIESVAFLRKHGAPFVLLHCNSTYPAPFKDINLSYMDRLKEIGECPVGYSGHERGYHVAIAAVARGARIIEKHITLDRDMEGSDHKVSLLPAEFRIMMQGIREVEASLGKGKERILTQGEMMNREILAKSLIAACEIPAGTVITETMINIKSPGKGLQPNR